jgi:hypothetical protein
MALIIVFPAPELQSWNATGQSGYNEVSGGLVYPPYQDLAAKAAEIISYHLDQLGNSWGQNCKPPHIIVRKISDPNAISPEGQIQDPAEIIVEKLRDDFTSGKCPDWIREQLQEQQFDGIAVKKSLPFCPKTYVPKFTALTYGATILVPYFPIAEKRRNSLTKIALKPNQLLVFSSEAGKLTLSENTPILPSPKDCSQEERELQASYRKYGVIYTFSREELKAR